MSEGNQPGETSGVSGPGLNPSPVVTEARPTRADRVMGRAKPAGQPPAAGSTRPADRGASQHSAEARTGTDAPTAAAAAAVMAPQPRPSQQSDPLQRASTATSATTSQVAAAETRSTAKTAAGPRTRKARLRLARVDPWSVMKTSFLFSIAGGIVLIVAVYVVWAVIGSSGLFDAMNKTVQDVVASPGDTTPFRVEDYINTNKVMGVTALVAVFDVLILTALATLGSFLYNLAATMLGGLEVTLAED